MPEAPDGGGIVRDERRPPFCYQTHAALELLREHFEGAKRSTALAVYVALTEAANRGGGEAARNGFTASRKSVAEAAGLSVDSLDRYVAEFVRIGLLGVERRRVEGVNLPNIWRLLDPAPVPGVAAPARPRGSRTGAALKGKRTTTTKKETASPSADRTGAGGAPALVDPDKPPRLVWIDGRDVAQDALAEECGVVDGSPRWRHVTTGINGRRNEEGIKHLFWREAYRWAVEHDALDRLALLYEDEERFARALERAIRLKAQIYRRLHPDWELTPTALLDWWLDLERAPERRDGGLTPDEIRAATGAGAAA